MGDSSNNPSSGGHGILKGVLRDGSALMTVCMLGVGTQFREEEAIHGCDPDRKCKRSRIRVRAAELSSPRVEKPERWTQQTQGNLENGRVQNLC